MTEARCSDYRLDAADLQAYLRKTFEDYTITVQCVNGHYTFNLPEGSTLTQSHLSGIDGLRNGKK